MPAPSNTKAKSTPEDQPLAELSSPVPEPAVVQESEAPPEPHQQPEPAEDKDTVEDLVVPKAVALFESRLAKKTDRTFLPSREAELRPMLNADGANALFIGDSVLQDLQMSSIDIAAALEQKSNAEAVGDAVRARTENARLQESLEGIGKEVEALKTRVAEAQLQLVEKFLSELNPVQKGRLLTALREWTDENRSALAEHKENSVAIPEPLANLVDRWVEKVRDSDSTTWRARASDPSAELAIRDLGRLLRPLQMHEHTLDQLTHLLRTEEPREIQAHLQAAVSRIGGHQTDLFQSLTPEQRAHLRGVLVSLGAQDPNTRISYIRFSNSHGLSSDSEVLQQMVELLNVEDEDALVANFHKAKKLLQDHVDSMGSTISTRDLADLRHGIIRIARGGRQTTVKGNFGRWASGFLMDKWGSVYAQESRHYRGAIPQPYLETVHVLKASEELARIHDRLEAQRDSSDPSRAIGDSLRAVHAILARVQTRGTEDPLSTIVLQKELETLTAQLSDQGRDIHQAAKVLEQSITSLRFVADARITSIVETKPSEDERRDAYAGLLDEMRQLVKDNPDLPDTQRLLQFVEDKGISYIEGQLLDVHLDAVDAVINRGVTDDELMAAARKANEDFGRKLTDEQLREIIREQRQAIVDDARKSLESRADDTLVHQFTDMSAMAEQLRTELSAYDLSKLNRDFESLVAEMVENRGLRFALATALRDIREEPDFRKKDEQIKTAAQHIIKELPAFAEGRTEEEVQQKVSLLVAFAPRKESLSNYVLLHILDELAETKPEVVADPLKKQEGPAYWSGSASTEREQDLEKPPYGLNTLTSMMLIDRALSDVRAFEAGVAELERLAKAATEQGDAATAEDMEFALTKRSLAMFGQLKELSNKEFASFEELLWADVQRTIPAEQKTKLLALCLSEYEEHVDDLRTRAKDPRKEPKPFVYSLMLKLNSGQVPERAVGVPDQETRQLLQQCERILGPISNCRETLDTYRATRFGISHTFEQTTKDTREAKTRLEQCAADMRGKLSNSDLAELMALIPVAKQVYPDQELSFLLFEQESDVFRGVAPAAIVDSSQFKGMQELSQPSAEVVTLYEVSARLGDLHTRLAAWSDSTDRQASTATALAETIQLLENLEQRSNDKPLVVLSAKKRLEALVTQLSYYTDNKEFSERLIKRASDELWDKALGRIDLIAPQRPEEFIVADDYNSLMREVASLARKNPDSALCRTVQEEVAAADRDIRDSLNSDALALPFSISRHMERIREQVAQPNNPLDIARFPGTASRSAALMQEAVEQRLQQHRATAFEGALRSVLARIK